MGGFDVVITGFRLNAREPAPKALSRVLGISLDEAKACAKRFPYVALANASEELAEELRAKLEEAGARVSVEARELIIADEEPVLVPLVADNALDRTPPSQALDLAPPAHDVAPARALEPLPPLALEPVLAAPPDVALPNASVPAIEPLPLQANKAPLAVAARGLEPAPAEPVADAAPGFVPFKPKRPPVVPAVSLSLAPEPTDAALAQDTTGMLLHTERDLQRDVALTSMRDAAPHNDGFLSLPDSEEETKSPDLGLLDTSDRALEAPEGLSPELQVRPLPALEPMPLLLPANEVAPSKLAPLPLYESLPPQPVAQAVALRSDPHELKPYALGDIVVDLSAPAKVSPAPLQQVAAAPPPATVNDFASLPPPGAALELDYAAGVHENSAPSGTRDLTSPKANNVTEAFGMGAGRDLDDSLNPEVHMPAPEIELVAPTATVSKNSPEKTADLWLVSSPKDSATGARVLAQVTGLPLDKAMRLVQTAPCLIASGWKLSKIKSAGSPLIAAGFELKVRASVA